MAHPDFEIPAFHDSLDEILPPSAMSTLVGHNEATQYLMSAALGGRHALILDGEQGIGKATAAFHLANALLDDNINSSSQTLPAPDINSTTYRQIAQNAHPNLLYLTRPKTDDGKSFKTVITVDEVRRIQRFLGFTSSGSERRIIIIDSLGDMNRNAANAILKMLEEPPSNTLFLLVSHGIGGLLPTIRSRCQIIRFPSLEESEVEEALRLIGGDMLSPDEFKPLSALSGGSVRHALLMARNGGLELQESLSRVLSAPNFDTVEVHKLADVAGARGADTHNLLLRQMLLTTLRERALSAAQAGDLNFADQIARFDQTLGERNRIADGFNLDRRQEFLIVASQVHSLLHAQ